MWHSKLDTYNRRTLGFVVQAGLTFWKVWWSLRKVELLVKLPEMTQFFLYFALNIGPITQGKNFVFLVNLLTRLLTSILTSKMISSSEGETRYTTTFARPWLSAIFVFFWSWTGGQFLTQLCHKQANNNKVSQYWEGKSLLIIIIFFYSKFHKRKLLMVVQKV